MKNASIEQPILLGRSVFARLITEFDANNIITRLMVREQDGYLLAWTRCDGEDDYINAMVRLRKKLKRKISYVYIIPAVPDDRKDLTPVRVKRTRVEFS